MQIDIGELHAFYLEPLGQVTRRLVAARVRALWPDVHGQTVVGLGFAAPYLRVFREEAARVAALMPAGQGSVPWPFDGRSLSALADEQSLPLADESVDRIIHYNALELSEAYRPLLRQVWRVLVPEGRLLVIAPNRSGLWSLTERTPFGHGHPYSRGQLARTLEASMFLPERWEGALYAPPLRWRWVVRTGTGWERAGRRFWPRFGGVHLVEATKTVYAGLPAAPVGARVRVAAPARA